MTAIARRTAVAIVSDDDDECVVAETMMPKTKPINERTMRTMF